ncbi:hypothetical protein B484DRAFT_106436 [Ochromonadaceae sp. CCMP2298]|nr:hypothetical protein B484DRAFT_106436 [Ochromonadaceae sp. CCMP2298]
MLTAIRSSKRQHHALFEYHFSSTQPDPNPFSIHENTELVDGIGGVSWDGALVLSKVLEQLTPAGHLVELGCGAGLAGIVASRLGFRATLTDRYADLAALNIAHAGAGAAVGARQDQGQRQEQGQG